MRTSFLLIGAAAFSLAGCGQSGQQAATETKAAANQGAASAPKPPPPHCFFTDAKTKGWAASRDRQGNVVVKGKAYREDPRYKAILEPPQVNGTTAVVTPSIAVNDTGYAAVENWWDVTATIPDSRGVDTVEVQCGAKTFAKLTVKRAH